MVTEQLSVALNTIKTHFVKLIVLKLTNKQFPCLSIDIEMVSLFLNKAIASIEYWIYEKQILFKNFTKAPHNSNNYRRLVHDLPVSIIPVREWEEYQQPTIKEYNVRKSNISKKISSQYQSYFKQISIQMPSLKSLRVLCDKMKNLAPTMTVCCLSSGDLSFIVETDSAIVVSRYFNLILDHCIDNNTDKEGQPVEICCHIDTKQLSMCFGSIQVNCTFIFIVALS